MDDKGPCKKNDIVMTTEAPLGEVAILDEKKYALGQRIILIRSKDGIVDPQYLYFAMQSEFAQGELLKRATGTTVLGIKHKELLDVCIPYFDFLEQKKIVRVLISYKTLIKNNNRRITILEEMAQKLYREWFVHFRFSGHENVKMVESELGLIPEGWSIFSFSEAVYINPKYAKPTTETFSYIDMAGLDTQSMVVSIKEKRATYSGSKFSNKDTIIARITPCLENGKTGFVQCLDEGEIGIGSTEFIILKSKKLIPEIVYLIARQDDFRDCLIKSMSGASGRQRANIAALNDYKIAIPPSPILENAQRILTPIFQQIEQLNQKTTNLRKTCDLLLPRLMSGDIDVSKLDIPIGEA